MNTKTWWTSDTHFGHANIIEYCKRPFRTASGHPDVDAMTRIMIQNWNQVVAPFDTVYHLGDFALGPREKHKSYLSRLNGKKVLIRGNHDGSQKKMEELGFDEVCVTKSMEIEGYRVYMAHIPLTVDIPDYGGRTYKSEFTPKPPPYYDFWFCGHIHDQFRRRGKVINVGVDVWGFKPVSFQELILAPDPS